MAKINIVVGTVMGNALEIAKTAESILQGYGHEPQLFERFDKRALDPENILLVITSSTGMGDIPQNILPLFMHLLQDKPQITGMTYGVISLGDSSYPNFAQAGHTFDEILGDSGAVRIHEVLILDALAEEDPHDQTEAWLSDWQQHI